MCSFMATCTLPAYSIRRAQCSDWKQSAIEAQPFATSASHGPRLGLLVPYVVPPVSGAVVASLLLLEKSRAAAIHAHSTPVAPIASIAMEVVASWR